MMQAIVHARYGSPDVLELRDTPLPEVQADGVLVRVCAAGVNAYDWHLMRGQPFPARMGNGLRRPASSALGVEMSGIVEAVGGSVTEFRPGDEVIGHLGASFSEYVQGAAGRFVAKPANVSFEQAAGLPVAGLTALQGLRDRGGLQAGQAVLVNGASGGVGTFAVQIAKILGAHVTGVCSTRNVDLVRSLGADAVIDYTREDFTRSSTKYDLIFDVAGSRPLRACRRLLVPSGRLIVVGGPSGRLIKPLDRMVLAVVLSRFGTRAMVPFFAKHSHEDLVTLRDLVAAGRLVPTVDRTYPLAETAAAVRYVETGHARAKVVITMGSPGQEIDGRGRPDGEDGR
jgi:NADPH:quinone reductase-like Zn-dependent oxidoreductase